MAFLWKLHREMTLLNWHFMYMQTSSHATCQETLSHSHLNSLSHCGLILAQESGIGLCQLSPLKTFPPNLCM